MTNFVFSQTIIKDLFIISTNKFEDERGQFSRLFCSNELSKIGWTKTKLQSNLSKTREKGTIRGMHYQNTPFEEAKIVFCLSGKIFDTIIDIRQNSPTFLKHLSFEISENDNYLIAIPKGCAHGFQSLTDNTTLLYYHSEIYNKSAEGVINPMDSTLNIKWPLKPTIISEKDINGMKIKSNFKGIKV